MNQSDWAQLAAARGLRLSEAELSKLAVTMDLLEPAYQALTAGLTYEVEPVTTFGEEAVEGR